MLAVKDINAAGGVNGQKVQIKYADEADSSTPQVVKDSASSLLTWAATRWAHRNRERRSVRAFKQGMAPLVIGLLLATAWVLGSAHGEPAQDWPLWLLSAATTLLVWRTRIHLLWLLGAGALLGAFGWV